MAPRHYLYVCDSKIDSLYLQIPEKQRAALDAALGLEQRLGEAPESETQGAESDGNSRLSSAISTRRKTWAPSSSRVPTSAAG
jgi:hypothetical protein